jgi:flagellar hook-length control protein FliK
MESSSINTLTGLGDKRVKKETGSVGGNADAFQTAMGEAGAGEVENKKADLIQRDAKDSDKAKDAAAESKDSGKDVKKSEGRLSDYVKNIQSKDPATLSMVEKSAFRMGEFSANPKTAGSPASGLAQMLASQGIDVSGFSPEQIKGLLSRMDTKELGKMLSQARIETGANSSLAQDEKHLKDLKEKLVQAAQNSPVEQQAFNLEQLISAGSSKTAGEAARAEQRRQIMDQILAQIDVRNVANQTEMNLRLNPEYLGEVKISLVHDDEGGVKALFKTTSKATREVLDESSADLINQARGKGVRIGSMAVQLVDDVEAS